MTYNQHRIRNPRGSVLIMVVAILVLLVILATIFLSRGRSIRLLSVVGQNTSSIDSRSNEFSRQLSLQIGNSLLGQPVNALYETEHPGEISASSAFPLLPPIPNSVRYWVDENYKYNFAPYEVRPWTNWPDLYGQLPEGNPTGNPGFGDYRWLRNTEPVRLETATGPAFSHWSHLSWIPTANNDWRLVTDISDVEKNTLNIDWKEPNPSTFLSNNTNNRFALQIPYEQWLPSVAPVPSYWIPKTIGNPPPAPLPPLFSGLQKQAADKFTNLAFGQDNNSGWFSNKHYDSLLSSDTVLPNFLRLKWFGPKWQETYKDSPRNIIARTLCDADGDGFTDSFWFTRQGQVDNSLRTVVGVSVVDNSALLNVNIATRFDPATTAGKTPSDLALVARQDLVVVPPNYPIYFRPNQISSFGPLYLNEVGFFSSPLNVQPIDLYMPTEPPQYPPEYKIEVNFDPFQFGSPVRAVVPNPTLINFPSNFKDITFLRELGVVRKSASIAAQPIVNPFFSEFLRSDLERCRYFKTMNNFGSFSSGFIPISVPDGGSPLLPQSEMAWGYGGLSRYFTERFTPDPTWPPLVNAKAYLAGVGSSGDVLEQNMLKPFLIEDELELRAFAGNNEPTIRSSLEDALTPKVPGPSESPISYRENQFLRSTATRLESSEVDQLDAKQLLYDNRRKLTVVSGARNELMPPWMWTMPPSIDPRQLWVLPETESAQDEPVWEPYNDGAGWEPNAIRGWRPLTVMFDDYGYPYYGSATGPNKDDQFPLYESFSKGDGNCDGVVNSIDDELASSQFLKWNRKVDLNREARRSYAENQLLAPPFDPTSVIRERAYEVCETYKSRSLWTNDYRENILRVLERSLLSTAAFNIRGNLQELELPGTDRASVFGSQALNKRSLIQALTAAKSWTANIVAASDEPLPIPNVSFPDDPPNHPVDGLTFPLDELKVGSFIGQEKHPFIVQVFFAVVYPRTGKLVGGGSTTGGGGYVTFDPESDTDRARVILVVQIANPYNTPLDLTPYRLRAFDQVFSFLQPVVSSGLPTEGDWGYGPFPILGPATEEGPRSAIVFAIPKNINIGNAGVGETLPVDTDVKGFRTSIMNFLDLSHPWLRQTGGGIPSGAIVPNLLQEEIQASLSLAPPIGPAVLFPPSGADLFEDVQTEYADSLIFNASKVSTTESLTLAGSNNWSVKPKDYWDTGTQKPKGNAKIELFRFLGGQNQNPDSQELIVDRLSNEFFGEEAARYSVPQNEDQGVDKTWSDAVSRILDPNNRETVPPKYVPADAGSATGFFEHVKINVVGGPNSGPKDFLMSWVRISRPWILDVDKNNAITADERSPRFVFAKNSEPRTVGFKDAKFYKNGDPTGKNVYGEIFTLPKLLSQPDSISTDSVKSPLFIRSSESDQNPTPITIRGKPTNFTLKTMLDPVNPTAMKRIYNSFDDTTESSWPGIPGGATPQRVIYGDTGASFFEVDDQGQKLEDFPQYKNPMRMVQRDGPFEQIAEVFDVPVWGPIMRSENGDPPWTTFATYGEMAVRYNPEATTYNDWLGELETIWFPSLDANRGGTDSMFFKFDRERQTGFDSGNNPSIPSIPFGASLLDAFTLDGAGKTRVDVETEQTGTYQLDGYYSDAEKAVAELRRLRLAQEFDGSSTFGLININTAPIEVMRALPNLQHLSYNSELFGTNPPTPAIKRVLLPETIVNYRDRFPAVAGFPDGPKYDDRGFVPAAGTTDYFPFHPGMRGERGFVSVGELALLDREYRPSNIVTTPPQVDPESGVWPDWSKNKSWSINFAGRDPYRSSEDPPVTTPQPTPHAPSQDLPPWFNVGEGWRSQVNGGGFSSQLSTERLAQNVIEADDWDTYGLDMKLQTAKIAGDQIERNTLLKGIANIVTTRSDIFTVYIKLKTFRKNEATQKWDAMDETSLLDESRYVMVVDRSQVNKPGDEPVILLFSKIED